MKRDSFRNAEGKPVLTGMVSAIAENKAYLSEIDGLIGDGDHGVNMNKGFSRFGSKIEGQDITLSEGFDELGGLLLAEIGGSMGPIYGAIFMGMAEACEEAEDIGAPVFLAMLETGRDALYDIVEARQGDKTLVDVLAPAIDAFADSLKGGADFSSALAAMTSAAEKGRDSTKDLVARYGRSRALGERSRGVLDAGSVSCCLLLSTMASEINRLLEQ